MALRCKLSDPDPFALTTQMDLHSPIVLSPVYFFADTDDGSRIVGEADGGFDLSAAPPPFDAEPQFRNEQFNDWIYDLGNTNIECDTFQRTASNGSSSREEPSHLSPETVMLADPSSMECDAQRDQDSAERLRFNRNNGTAAYGEKITSALRISGGDSDKTMLPISEMARLSEESGSMSIMAQMQQELGNNATGGTTTAEHSSKPISDPIVDFFDDASHDNLHEIVGKFIMNTALKVPTSIASRMRYELLFFYQKLTNQWLPDQEQKELITKITEILTKELDKANQIVEICHAVFSIFRPAMERNTLADVPTPMSNSAQPEGEPRPDKRMADFTDSSKPPIKRPKTDAEGKSQSQGHHKYRCDEGYCDGKLIRTKAQWRKHTQEIHFPPTIFLCPHCSFPQTRKDHCQAHFERHLDRQGDFVADACELADTYHRTCPYCQDPLSSYKDSIDHIQTHQENDGIENLQYNCCCGPLDWKNSDKIPQKSKEFFRQKKNCHSLPLSSYGDIHRDEGDDDSSQSRDMNGSSGGDPNSNSGGSQSRTMSGGRSGADTANKSSGQTNDADGTGDAEGQLDPLTGKIIHDALKVVRKLGEGAFGEVDMVEKNTDIISISSSLQIFARKNIQLCSKCPAEQLPEINILRLLNHAHIIKLAGYYTFHDRAWFLMSPVANSDLHVLLHRHQIDSVRLRCLKLWFSCLASALAYLHGQDIIHGDIKPMNVLVYSTNQTCRAFLSDFGSARRINATNTLCRHSGLTPKYGAPELHHETSTGQSWSLALDSAADIFSLGCVFLEMATVLSGRSVESFENFRSKGLKSTSFYATLPNAMRWIDIIRTSIPWDCQHTNNCLNTIKEMLDPDPWRRPTAKDVARSFPQCICKPFDQNSGANPSRTDFVKAALPDNSEDAEYHSLSPNVKKDYFSVPYRVVGVQKLLRKAVVDFVLRSNTFDDQTTISLMNRIRFYWLGARSVVRKSTLLSFTYDGSHKPPRSLGNPSIMVDANGPRHSSQFSNSDECGRAVCWLEHGLDKRERSKPHYKTLVDNTTASWILPSKNCVKSKQHFQGFSAESLPTLIVLAIENISTDLIDSLRCRLFLITLLVLQTPSISITNSPATLTPTSLFSNRSKDLVSLVQMFAHFHGQEIFEGLKRIRTTSQLEHDLSSEEMVLKFVEIHRDLTNQACRFERAGRFAEAELLCRVAVTSGEKILGPNNSRTNDSICCLLRILDKNGGQEQEVRDLTRRASEWFKNEVKIERGQGEINPIEFGSCSMSSIEATKPVPMHAPQPTSHLKKINTPRHRLSEQRQPKFAQARQQWQKVRGLWQSRYGRTMPGQN